MMASFLAGTSTKRLSDGWQDPSLAVGHVPPNILPYALAHPSFTAGAETVSDCVNTT